MTLWKLEIGTKLYHGTTEDFSIDELQTPAWLTEEYCVAVSFTRFFDLPPDAQLRLRVGGKAPRIMVFQVLRTVELVEFRSSSDMQSWAANYSLKYWDAIDLAEELCKEHSGWIVPHNHKCSDGVRGSDILVCKRDLLLPLEEIEL